MKVLLVSPSVEDESRCEEGLDSHYPLGIGYLHAYLEQQGHTARTLFLNSVTHEVCMARLQAALAELQPEVVGLQLITNNRVSAFRILDYLHAHHPGIRIVLGGIHTSVMYAQILARHPYAIAVLGEGELTLAELVQTLGEGGDLGGVKGLAYHDGAQVVTTPPRELIQDLDILPFPKHEIFMYEGKTLANLLTTRGCPFACSFCVLDSVSRRKVRYRSVANVVDEVEYLVRTFPSLRNIWIHDDSFFLDNARVIAFCEEVQRRGIRTDFICSARFKPLSAEVVRALEAAGFSHVLFGLETGAEELLKTSHKGITKDDARRAFQLFAGSSVKVTAFLIVGLPGETEATLQETGDLIQELQNINYTYYDEIGILMVYPGTEIHRACLAAGAMREDYWLTDGPVPFYTVEHPEPVLRDMAERLRDRISLNRILTPQGFLAQRKLIPRIIDYALRFNVPAITSLLMESMNRYRVLHELLLGDRDLPRAELRAKAAQSLEFVLLENVLQKLPEPERAPYLESYKQQVRRDALRERSRQMMAAAEA